MTWEPVAADAFAAFDVVVAFVPCLYVDAVEVPSEVSFASSVVASFAAVA